MILTLSYIFAWIALSLTAGGIYALVMLRVNSRGGE